MDEQSSGSLIRAKLRQPELPELVLSRPRLLERLRQALQRPLTVVCAAPGYGKTTLVADFVRRHARNAVWYRVDQNDADVGFFLAHVVEALRQNHPEFGSLTLGRLRTSPNPTRETVALFGLLSAELERVGLEGLVMVLDDFQEASDSRPLVTGMGYLVSHLPSHVHLVIASRTEPLPLERAQLAGDLVRIIDEEDLAFTEEEVRHLLGDVYGVHVSPKAAQNLVVTSGGWVIPVVMAAQAWRQEAGASARVIPKRNLFNYFSQELLDALNPAARRFLVETCLLPWIDPSLAREFLGAGGPALLEESARRHLLLSASGDPPVYRYHSLFRAFLQERLAQSYDLPRIRRLRLRAARLLESHGAVEEALEQYLLGGKPSAADRLLVRQVSTMQRTWQFTRLLDLIDRLPRATLSQQPALLLARGRALESMGDHEAARHCYQEARRKSRQQDSIRSHGASLVALGRLARIEGRVSQGATFLREGMGHLRGPGRRAVLAELAGVEIILGRYREAERLCRQLLSASSYAGDGAGQGDALHILGLLYYFFMGRPIQGLQSFREAVRVKEENDLTPGVPFTQSLFAFALQINGAHREAEELAESAIATARLYRLARDEGFARAVKGTEMVLRGDTEEGLGHLREAARILEEIRDPWVAVPAYTGLLQAYEQRGDHSAAEQALAALHECGRRLGDDYHPAWALVVEGSYRRRRGDLAGSKSALERALPLAGRSGAPLLLIPAHLQMAWLDHSAGRIPEAHESLRKAAELLSHHPYRGFPVLGADEASRLLGDASVSSAELRQAVGPLLHSLRPEEPLSFFLLGGFQVLRGDRPLEDADWQRPRVRALCKYLLTYRERPVSREEICEALWPELSLDAARNNLRWALSILRRVLGPRLQGRPSAVKAKRERSVIQLSLSEEDRVDVGQFLDAIREAGGAISGAERAVALQRAVALYRGDYLAEDAYADWAVVPREQLRSQFLTALTGLASYQEEHGNPSGALSQWQGVLAKEPENETAHQGAMRCYGALGDPAGVRRQYDQCLRILRQELEVEPSPETVELFGRLVQASG